MSDQQQYYGSEGPPAPPPEQAAAPVSDNPAAEPAPPAQTAPDPEAAFEAMLNAVERIVSFCQHLGAVLPSAGAANSILSAMGMHARAAREALHPPVVMPPGPPNEPPQDGGNPPEAPPAA